MNPEPYDFRKPVRLAPEWQKLLLTWFQTSAALAARAWSKQIPVALELTMGPLEDVHAHTALAELPADAIGQRIAMATGTVPTMFVVPRPLLLNVIGAMLGESHAHEDRDLTTVEEELADYFIVNHWLPFFVESWPGPPVPAGQLWQLQHREAQPSYSRLFEPTEVLVKLNWKLRGPFGEGKGQWLFPRKALLQAVRKDQSSEDESSDEKVAAARKAQIVRTLPLSIECILGTAQLRLSELSRLQVGDVLLLDQRTGDNVTAFANGQQLFRGQVGRNGSWKAFRVESFIEKLP